MADVSGIIEGVAEGISGASNMMTQLGYNKKRLQLEGEKMRQEGEQSRADIQYKDLLGKELQSRMRKEQVETQLNQFELNKAKRKQEAYDEPISLNDIYKQLDLAPSTLDYINKATLGKLESIKDQFGKVPRGVIKEAMHNFAISPQHRENIIKNQKEYYDILESQTKAVLHNYLDKNKDKYPEIAELNKSGLDKNSEEYKNRYENIVRNLALTSSSRNDAEFDKVAQPHLAAIQHSNGVVQLHNIMEAWAKEQETSEDIEGLTPNQQQEMKYKQKEEARKETNFEESQNLQSPEYSGKLAAIYNALNTVPEKGKEAEHKIKINKLIKFFIDEYGRNSLSDIKAIIPKGQKVDRFEGERLDMGK